MGHDDTDGHLLQSGLWFSLGELLLRDETPSVLVLLGMLETGLLESSVVVTVSEDVGSGDSVSVRSDCD